MNIAIDKDAVEQAVVQAIINSAIGAKIALAVNELLSKYGYNNPIQQSVERVISEVALKMIRDEYTDQIRAAVAAKLKEETVDAFVGLFWDKLILRER